jgi:hypothetical protein
MQNSSKVHNKERKDKNREKKEEVLLSAIYSGEATPKKKVTLFH